MLYRVVPSGASGSEAESHSLSHSRLASSYAKPILGAKLALTIAVGAVGFHHSRHGAGRARTDGPSAVRRTLLGETLLVIGAIGVTAALVATAPPMGSM